MDRPLPPRSYIMYEGSTKRYYVDSVPHAMRRHHAAKQAAADKLIVLTVTVAALIALWFAL